MPGPYPEVIRGSGAGDTLYTNSTLALDGKTGKLKWWQRWQAICYSGSVNTAGGLTFVGHYGTGDGSKGDGYLAAVDTKTGKELWKSATMPHPVASAPVTYTGGGKQYVTVQVGGAAHNDVTRPFGSLDARRNRGDLIYSFVLP